jgi:hypothetical protein
MTKMARGKGKFYVYAIQPSKKGADFMVRVLRRDGLEAHSRKVRGRISGQAQYEVLVRKRRGTKLIT